MHGRRLFAFTTLLILTFVLTAHAEVSRMELQVNGLACPFCAYGLEKKLKKVAGVKAIDIDINTGRVVLNLDGTTTPDPKQIREAVKKAGFTLESLRITARGQLVRQGDKVFLVPTHSDQKFLLFEKEVPDRHYFSPDMLQKLNPLIKTLSIVEITGTLHEHREGVPGLALEEIHELNRAKISKPNQN